MKTFRDVVAIWGTPDVMAAELRLSVDAVRHWKTRDSIPSEYWTLVVKASRAKGVKLDEADLARFKAKKRTTAKAAKVAEPRIAAE